MPVAPIDVCFVCEAVRPELNNKTILLGFYGLTPYVKVRFGNLQLNASLCFVFSGGPTSVREKYSDIRLRIFDPTGVEVTNDKNAPPIKDGMLGGGAGGTNLFLSFFGVLGKTGIFRVALVVNGVEHYSTTIGIEQGIPAAGGLVH
jgi:hypothetical protein